MNNTEVEIFGGTYTVKGDSDPAYVRELARYVDEKMRTLSRKSPHAIGVQKIAVLAALNIADELFRLKRRGQDVDKLIVEKTADLFDLLKDEGPDTE
ncbi:MAG: cell division protein ZapA [Nitrospirae bacterium]|nr:cell division protein ZapA [Nitrospirota bacterium]MBI5695938.1 cell division protein ZapA [Nitrospirota bacterium]